jgi:hypothetical protein
MTHSLTELTWVKYPIAVACVIVYLTIVGLPYVFASTRKLPSYFLILTPNLGMATVITAASLYGFVGSAVSPLLVYAFAFVFAALAALLLVRNGSVKWDRQSLRQSLRAAGGSVAWPWTLGIALVTIFMYPAISLGHGYMTTFVTSNNDVGSYLAEATNFAVSGFRNAGYWFGWDGGSDASTLAAKTDHTGVSAILAAIAALFGQPVWKVGTVTMMVAGSSLVAGTVAYCRSICELTDRTSLVIGAFASSSLVVWYMASNYFLAQVICVSLLLGQLTLVNLACDHEWDWRIVVSLGLLAAATILASPEFQTVAVALAVATMSIKALVDALAGNPKAEVARKLGGGFVRYGLSMGLAIALVFPFLSGLFGRVQRISDVNGVVGWSLDPSNLPATLFGVPDSFAVSSTGISNLLYVLCGVAVVAGIVRGYRKSNRKMLAAAIMTVVFFAACGVAGHRWGWATYQSWKLIFALTVPILVTIVALGLKLLPKSWREATLAIMIAIIGINLGGGEANWTPTRVETRGMLVNSLSSELTEFLESPEVQRQTGINFYMPSMWQTLAVPGVYGGKGAMSSPSYISSAKPGPKPYSCSLFERSLYHPAKGPRAKKDHVVAGTANYVLVATPSCR